MNHSDQSTSEENFEMKTDSRNSSSFASKKKQTKKIDSTSSEEVFDLEIDSDFPQSVEKTRYNQINEECFMVPIFDPKRMYTKQNPQKSRQKNKNLIIENCENHFERSQEPIISSNKNKKSSQVRFSPYDQSFDDRISIQTMDSKDFISSFECSEKGISQMNNYFQQSEEHSINRHLTNDKNYFDNHIIEHQNEEDYEKESNNEQIFQEYNDKRLIQLQNPHNHQDRMKISKKQQTPVNQETDEVEIKFRIRSKQIQLSEIRNAYEETTNENEIIRGRVKQLEACLIKIDQRNKQDNSFFKNFEIQSHQQHFRQSIKIFRKFSE